MWVPGNSDVCIAVQETEGGFQVATSRYPKIQRIKKGAWSSGSKVQELGAYFFLPSFLPPQPAEPPYVPAFTTSGTGNITPDLPVD